METTKINIARETFSTTYLKSSLFFATNDTLITVKNKLNVTKAITFIFSFFLFGSILLSACKKDIELIPATVNANLNDTTLKAGTTTYYISTTGTDAGTGDINHPWKTLYYASTRVTTPGSLIHIKAGTYVETHKCSIAVGVSVEGEGVNTIIKGQYYVAPSFNYTSATITLVSATAGTNGNQSISNLRLDGDGLKGSMAIVVKNRSNVKIRDCVIEHFFAGGVYLSSNAMYTEPIPSVYEKGNEIYNCKINDCGDAHGTISGNGLIFITCQDGLLIHHNTLTSNSRTPGKNGNIINAGGRHFKGMKYYNNISYKLDNEGSNWSFHLEFWKTEGGIEIYNNEFRGGDCAIDCGGDWSKKGSYGFAYSIHDNLFTPISNSVRSTYYGKKAITVEANHTESILIYNNKFNYGKLAIQVYPVSLEDLQIHHNTFNYVLHALYVSEGINTNCNFKRISFYTNLVNKCNFGTGYYNGAITIIAKRVESIYSDFSIYNNTIVSDQIVKMNAVFLQVGSTSGTTAIAGGTINNINIKNNIMCYFTNHGPIQIVNNGVINGLHIENNLSKNNSNYNILPYFWPYNKGRLLNYTYARNIPVSNITQKDPQFASNSDYHLKSTSPCINTGINVGLTFKASAPDKGAFEY